MLKVIFGVSLCMIHVSVNANFYKSNVTDLSKCKVHYSRSGSVYKDFYTLSELTNTNDTLELDFHFAVLAPSDAHILLAPSETVEKGDPVYEIVIGAGGNTFCDIRRKQKSDVKASVRIKGLLSALDPSSFWLHITKDGDISVGKEGEELPFISWVDPDPLPLKVISFSTWSGIEAKWYFDCERRNETEEIQKPQTFVEKLRQDLLYHYNPYVRPVKNVSTVTTVSMALHINHINLNEYKSNIEVLGMTKLAWHDEKLSWDPAEYGDLEALHIFRREIWQPEFVLYNAVGTGRDIIKDSMLVAHSTGLIEWNPAVYLNAWCDASDMGKWPKDLHKCNLILGFVKDVNYIQIEFNKNDSSLIYHESSEWAVLEVDIYGDVYINKTAGSSIFEIVFTLKRTSAIYNTIFFTPFLVISISVLSTFWMSPFSKTKIVMNCAQLVLTTLLLLAMAMFVPSHSKHIPYLVVLYSFTLVAILLSVMIAVVVINISRNTQKHPLPHCVCSVLTSKVIRIALCLPDVDMSDEYGKLNENHFVKSSENQQLLWIVLGTAVDRISFLIYLPITIYAIYLNY